MYFASTDICTAKVCFATGLVMLIGQSILLDTSIVSCGSSSVGTSVLSAGMHIIAAITAATRNWLPHVSSAISLPHVSSAISTDTREAGFVM